MKISSVIKNVIVTILVIGIFGYMFYRLYHEWGNLAEYNLQFNYLYLILSIIVFIFFYFLEGLGYYIFVRLINADAPFLKVLKSRYISDMGRYVPGKIWTVLWRLYFLKGYSITKLQIIVSSLIEMAMMCLGSLLMFLLTLLFWDARLQPWMYVVFLLIPAVFIAIYPKVLNWSINVIERIRGKEEVKIRTSYGRMLGTTLFYLFYWMVYGLGSFLLISSITPIGWELFPMITGVFAITWLLGFVSFLAPGGLGVRDGLLVYFLIFIFPEPIAIIITLVTRLQISLIEGVYAMVSLKF